MARLRWRSQSRASARWHAGLGKLHETGPGIGEFGLSSGAVIALRAALAETLLLDGERSSAYLKGVLNGLEPVLPRVRRVILTGVGHTAADNSEKPYLVAAELRRFFG